MPAPAFAQKPTIKFLDEAEREREGSGGNGPGRLMDDFLHQMKDHVIRLLSGRVPVFDDDGARLAGGERLPQQHCGRKKRGED